MAGYRILGVLLKEFTKAVIDPEDYYSKMLLPFVPQQFRVKPEDTTYHKLQSVLDFVSSMTDVYALDLYKKILGLGL